MSPLQVGGRDWSTGLCGASQEQEVQGRSNVSCLGLSLRYLVSKAITEGRGWTLVAKQGWNQEAYLQCVLPAAGLLQDLILAGIAELALAVLPVHFRDGVPTNMDTEGGTSPCAERSMQRRWSGWQSSSSKP